MTEVLRPIDFRRRDSVMAELRKNQRVGCEYFFGRYPPGDNQEDRVELEKSCSMGIRC